MRRTILILLAAALLTGCDQFFPYDKERVRECSEWRDWNLPLTDSTGLVVDTLHSRVRTCVDVWKRAD